MKRITIVGGGASGTLVAANLLRTVGGTPAELNLVESKRRLGRGVAFGTTQDSHLLNVPACRMGAFPDDVEHFHRWLGEKGLTFAANDFVPRTIYGEYLRSVLANALESTNSNVKLNLIDDEAVDMSVDGNAAQVILRSGEILLSDKVVLAFGNFAPPHPSVPDQQFASAEKYFLDPWNNRMYETIRPDDSIFIVGTGLSMVDVVLHFHKQNHRGVINAISTRGLLPEKHELGHSYPPFDDELKSMTQISDMLRTVRRHIAQAAAHGSNWRAVIDSLRPATQQIWQGLPMAEKRIFKQHLSRYWNVARHRMPADVGDILDKMQNEGSLTIHKGRLKEITHDGSAFRISYSALEHRRIVNADALINCIGSETDLTRIDKPFVRNLIERRHIRNDELSMGIDAAPDGRVVGKDGQPSDIVFTLGTAMRGILWETTAIPEIRTQAKELTLRLLAD